MGWVSMIHGIIFDFDGVLGDTHKMWIKIYRDIAHKVGISGLSEDEIIKNFGEKNQVVLEGLVGKERMPQALPLLKQVLSSGKLVDNLQLTPHVKEILEYLKKNDFSMAVVSGNDSVILEASLKKFKIDEYFITTIAGDQVNNAKPDPEALLRAIYYMGLPKSEVIYVGDAANDILAARRAGIRVAISLTGALNQEKASQLEPDWILKDLSELKALLE